LCAAVCLACAQVHTHAAPVPFTCRRAPSTVAPAPRPASRSARPSPALAFAAASHAPALADAAAALAAAEVAANEAAAAAAVADEEGEEATAAAALWALMLARLREAARPAASRARALKASSVAGESQGEAVRLRGSVRAWESARSRATWLMGELVSGWVGKEGWLVELIGWLVG